MSPRIPSAPAVALATLALVPCVVAQSPQSAPSVDEVAFVQTANSQHRLQYLANSQIWSDPGDLTPEMVLRGQPLEDPTGLEAAIRGEPLPCTFTRAGKDLGGNTPKFVCLTADKRAIRVKYTDGSKGGNREIFAAVAASRLLWILGFESDPIYPITVDCLDCPENPMAGSGSRAKRTYLATFQPLFHYLVIVTGDNPNQGWRWAEVDDAIAGLPEGPVRARQRAHFDALKLLAVFVQHGDRKPEQQRLHCRAALDRSAGDVRLLKGDDDADNVPVFFERPDGTACRLSVIAIQDMGATFGGAGKMSNPGTAKMNLKEWTDREVFHKAKADSSGVSECRGNITVSMAAGEGSQGNPRIGEAGRAFLADRLKRLTDEHLRALLSAARVDKVGTTQTWQDPTGTVHTGLDAWAAAFKDKVRQVTERRCAA